MTWKNPGKAVALGRDDPIKDLGKKDLLTLKKTKTVVSCAIIKVLAGSMGAAVRVLEIINTALAWIMHGAGMRRPRGPRGAGWDDYWPSGGARAWPVRGRARRP